MLGPASRWPLLISSKFWYKLVTNWLFTSEPPISLRLVFPYLFSAEKIFSSGGKLFFLLAVEIFSSAECVAPGLRQSFSGSHKHPKLLFRKT